MTRFNDKSVGIVDLIALSLIIALLKGLKNEYIKCSL